MKKAICFALFISILLSLCSCSLFGEGKKEETVLETTSQRKTYITRDELKNYASQGKVVGVNHALGAAADDVKKAFLDDLQPESATVATKYVKKKGKRVKVTIPNTTQNPQYETYIGNESYYEYYVGNSLTSISYKNEKYFYVNQNMDKGAAIIVTTADAYNFIIGNCYSADIIHSLGEADFSDVPTSDQLFFCPAMPVNPTRLTYVFGDKRVDFVLSDDKLSVVVLTDTTLYSGFKSVSATTSSSLQTTTASAN